MLTIVNNNTNTNTNTNTTPTWYYKDDDDEFEMYGFDEQTDLEKKWQKYRNDAADRYQEISCGYFANCSDKHHIDFLNLMQCNTECNEARNMIRALSNAELNDNYLGIASQNLPMSGHKDNKQEYGELRNNLLREEDCGGDAVTINIPSIIHEILNDTIYIHSKQHDIPIAVVVVEGSDRHECLNNIDTICNEAMDIVNLCDLRLRVTSSMISYLIAQAKCNLILYDTEFRLLAVGKYKGSYIHQYCINHINPYRYQSFLNFYSLLSAFCELLQIRSLISSFNQDVRICVKYENGTALWTPSIADRQSFKQIHKSIDINMDHRDKERYDYASDEDSVYENIECSVCYENITNQNTSRCLNHNDLCDSCLLQWRQSGHDSCPKCGISHDL